MRSSPATRVPSPASRAKSMRRSGDCSRRSSAQGWGSTSGSVDRSSCSAMSHPSASAAAGLPRDHWTSSPPQPADEFSGSRLSRAASGSTSTPPACPGSAATKPSVARLASIRIGPPSMPTSTPLSASIDDSEAASRPDKPSVVAASRSSSSVSQSSMLPTDFSGASSGSAERSTRGSRASTRNASRTRDTTGRSAARLGPAKRLDRDDRRPALRWGRGV